MYIRQQCILSFEEILKFQPETKLEKIFSEIDFSEILSMMPRSSKFGPKGHVRECMLYSLLAMKLENIKYVANLVKRLKQDPVFRYNCGFNVIGDVPSESTYSRFIDKLSESGALMELFQNLVQKALDMGIIDGSTVAIDSSGYESYDAAKPKSKIEKNGVNPDWGSKKDTDGNQIKWFGWKLHIAVDCKSGLPLALVVTPANEADSVMALPLIDRIKAAYGEKLPTDFYMMDAGYDVNEIYTKVKDVHHAQAIIPLNHRGAYAPPEGLDYNGVPVCSMGYSMTYWGNEAGCHKFRCPHVTGKLDCPQGSNWCSSSDYGAVVKKHVDDDPRMFPAPHRCTKKWKKLYDQRTSVERCFSMLKEHLGLTNLSHRGIKKATFNALLSCIAMIAGTIAVNTIKTDSKAA